MKLVGVVLRMRKYESADPNKTEQGSDMSAADKQPLIGGEPSAPPPYAPPKNPHGYPPPVAGGAAYPPPQAPPPAYGHPQTPAGYGATPHITVVQAAPIVTRRTVIEPKPPNHILLSLIVFLMFCWVFGLIALIMGMQVDSAWAAGDGNRARRLSASARGWNLAGMIFGSVLYVTIVVSSVTSSAAGT
ncbi:hypothetical protein GBAR_LOCUS20207 [Geodia barretti]|uniref:Interferon-induced transmembrane protein n=1 Tax=Geodia barretti TaxID=519541 RepID=A0AA35SUP4_GEOBA|nr:hypothetical protein GBAR_LOCUS20207 [Geodia barretti]